VSEFLFAEKHCNCSRKAASNVCLLAGRCAGFLRAKAGAFRSTGTLARSMEFDQLR